jgi:hypothetical protein
MLGSMLAGHTESGAVNLEESDMENNIKCLWNVSQKKKLWKKHSGGMASHRKFREKLLKL